MSGRCIQTMARRQPGWMQAGNLYVRYSRMRLFCGAQACKQCQSPDTNPAQPGACSQQSRTLGGQQGETNHRHLLLLRLSTANPCTGMQAVSEPLKVSQIQARVYAQHSRVSGGQQDASGAQRCTVLTFLPRCAGMQAVSEPLKVSQIQPSGELMNSLLGLSHAKTPEQLLSANTAGFIYITDVNPATGTISFLAPCPGALPCKYLLWGSLRVML